MFGRRLGVLALVLATVVAAGSCGGGEDEGNAEPWAEGVCSSLNGWITELDETVQSLTAEGLDFDEADVRDAVDRAAEATDELVDDLEELGRPETDGGEQAQQELDALGTALRNQLETVEQALDADTEPLALAGTVTAAVAAAISELQQTLADLEGLDPGGKLEDAFRNSEECDAFEEEIAKFGG